MPYPLIPITPQARLERERAQFQRTPNIGYTSKMFTPTEIEQNPELQRGLRPFEASAFREALDIRNQRAQQEKVMELYRAALPTIDKMNIPDTMKNVLKAGLISAGPKTVIGYLQSVQKGEADKALAILKGANQMALERLKQSGRTFEPPKALGKPFPKGTVGQRKGTGEMKLLVEPKQPTPKAPPGEEDIRGKLRQWVDTANRVQKGDINAELITMMESALPQNEKGKAINAYGTAIQSRDTTQLQQMVQEQIKVLQDKLDEFEIKSQYPGAQKDQYGHFVVKDGKKYYITRTE